MQFYILASALFVAVTAYGNGGGRSAGGYGGNGGGNGGGYGGGNGRGFSGNGGGAGQVVEAAIQSRHNVEFRDVPSSGSASPTTVEVGANSLPVTLLFRSASSSLNVQQQHDGAQGSTQESSSDDEAHVLKHSVNKPIIQEIREVITPFRKITQEIQPVQEEINTIVSRNSGNSGNTGGSFGASGFGGAGLGSSGAGFGGAGRSSGAGFGSGAGRGAGGYGSGASSSGKAY